MVTLTMIHALWIAMAFVGILFTGIIRQWDKVANKLNKRLTVLEDLHKIKVADKDKHYNYSVEGPA